MKEAKYLGLPESLNGSKVELFQYIKDAVKARLSGWYARFLSQVGKEVLMKTVISVLPVYAMSCFRLPKSVCQNIESAMGDFWWSQVELGRKIHWLSWEKLCLPKSKGGMGFKKNLECFNQALLAKQAWKLINSPSCLLFRILQSRYYQDDQFLNASLGSSPSYGWRSILFGRDLLTLGLKRLVGNGSSVKVWTESWLEDVEGFLRPPYRKQLFFDVNLLASDLIDPISGKWRRSSLEDIFVRDDVMNLLRNQPCIDKPDSFIWRFSKQGLYSVKSGYEMAFNMKNSTALQEANTHPSVNELKRQIWKTKAPPKLKIFLWKAISGALAVDDCLATRGVKAEGVCQVCGDSGESINHLLFACTYARQVWALTDIPHPRNGFDDFSVFSNFNYLLRLMNRRSSASEIRRMFPWVAWYLWKNRNALIFEGRSYNALDCVKKIKEESDLWFLAQHNIRPLLQTVAQSDGSVQGGKRWKPPVRGWLKCNIGAVWSKACNSGGMAWVLRDHFGRVKLHSRRSMTNLHSLAEVWFTSLVWAMESMVSHHISRVLFTVNDNSLLAAIIRPPAWPSFRSNVGQVFSTGRLLGDWKVVFEDQSANRGAHLIAKSVISQDSSFVCGCGASFLASLSVCV